MERLGLLPDEESGMPKPETTRHDHEVGLPNPGVKFGRALLSVLEYGQSELQDDKPLSSDIVAYLNRRRQGLIEDQ